MKCFVYLVGEEDKVTPGRHWLKLSSIESGWREGGKEGKAPSQVRVDFLDLTSLLSSRRSVYSSLTILVSYGQSSLVGNISPTSCSISKDI